MIDIAIYGAGGFGRETALMIDQINRVEKRWQVTGFYDDGMRKGENVDGLPVLGGIEEVNHIGHSTALAIAIADPATRKKIVSIIRNNNISYPVLVHPLANLGSETNWVGEGVIITAQSILTTGIVLGDFSIINLSVTIGHDARIGSFCSVMPGCSISGNVQIGEGSMVGTGARILQNITIGRYCKVGAGAVVTKSWEDGVTIVGVPAIKVE